MTELFLRDSTWMNVLKVIGKTLVILILLILFFIGGLFIGYSVIGEGNFWEVLNRDTWEHIINFVK